MCEPRCKKGVRFGVWVWGLRLRAYLHRRFLVAAEDEERFRGLGFRQGFIGA